MARRAPKQSTGKTVEALKHDEAKRKNIPTAEYQSVIQKEEEKVRTIKYPRNTDLDPQLVWRGKDEQDWSDLVVHAPPLYIQEKVHPKVIIDDLMKSSEWIVASRNGGGQSTGHQSLSTVERQLDMFADFNGIPAGVDRTEFYQHDQNWSNRMILGDSLQVMASLAEREGLRGKVQCIYIDPPYGIKFNKNFQWSTTDRATTTERKDFITREPEQVKAFRDTWRDGIHSYLTYLRDRFTVARDLLAESGSIFVQIGDENVHRVRALMEEVFGAINFVSLISVQTTTGFKTKYIGNIADYVLWFAKDKERGKSRAPLYRKDFELGEGNARWLLLDDFTYRGVTAAERRHEQPIPVGSRPYKPDNIISQGRAKSPQPFEFQGKTYDSWSKNSHWKASHPVGMTRLARANRIHVAENSIQYIRFHTDFDAGVHGNVWTDTGSGNFTDEKVYIVQTNAKVIERCLLMATDPGDLILDPTCGSGTTAYVAEQWGRRWITIDTSRVALALARARIMGARYPFYILSDSREGQLKEAEVSGTAPSSQPTSGNIRHGFVYERVPHIMLETIANNAEIDVIWEKWQKTLAPLRDQLSVASGQKKTLEEWEIPREIPKNWPPAAQPLFTQFWEARIARQKEIDASIAAKAEFEYLYDKPYPDNTKVRVAGPFTVESLSPHRVLGVNENDELIDSLKDPSGEYGAKQSFPQMILENLKTAGAQQAHKEDRIVFTALTPWPGELVCGEGRFEASGQWLVNSGQQEKPATSHSSLSTNSRTEMRAGIFIGPEFGTVQRSDLVAAAREAGDAGFDVLIACAFNYEAHTTEFNKLGRIPVLKARMNADLHMAENLKNTGKGNLFVIFGEPDIVVASEEWIVDSTGKRIAPYEIFKLVSGVGGLAEINRLGREDLRDYARLSRRREIWDYITNAAGGNLDTGKHSGGTGAKDDGGVSTVAWHCAGIAGGTGNVSDVVRKIGSSQQNGLRSLAQRLRRDQQNDSRAHEIAIHSPLVTNHYSQITVRGVDVFKPQTGEVISDGADGIACWFIDTDYNEESFFVRHAYFLGQNDPYSALKTTLKAEIDPDAWATLHSDTSRPFEKPKSGRIAVKVINHLGDEVMKVFKVP
jgi:adenine-specific DNA-methyltransferase